jgi:hypothetical protein
MDVEFFKSLYGIGNNVRKDPEMATEEDSVQPLKKPIRLGTAAILVLAVVFLAYQFYLLQNSFSALYNIALTANSRWQATGNVWNLVWLTGESSGEVGLLVRFVDALFFVAVAWLLFREQRFSVSLFRKAAFLEATYFLLYIPFVVYLLTRPSYYATGFETGLSYGLQILLVSPSLFMLYRKLKQSDRGSGVIVRWFAIAFCFYIFALWVKGFFFAIYAIGIGFTGPIVIVGSVNSIVTLLLAGFGALAIFLPVIRGKRAVFSWRWLGAVLVCAGLYFVVFDLVSWANTAYLRWVGLTEWWAASLIVPGLALVVRGRLT